MINKLRKYIEENYEEEALYELSEESMDYSCAEAASIPQHSFASPFLGKRASKESSSINDYIEQNNIENKFQTQLFKYIDERNLKDSDVYNKVHIDRRLFSKIRGDSNYHPSKETIILLGISLKLTEQELEKLLESASYSLPKNNYFDLIIRFCFINKIYDIDTINNFLEEYNCKLFNY